MLLQTKLYTVEEFENFITLPENSERDFELVHGEIVEKTMPTEVHGRLTVSLIFEVRILQPPTENRTSGKRSSQSNAERRL